MPEQTRQLAAIMFTDIVGYTKLMGEDEERAFELLKKNRRVQRPIIEKFNGKWLKEIGDGILASFNNVSDAVNCAKKIQEQVKKEKGLKLRIGLHEGEVVFQNQDVFGDGVNIASRLQEMAPAGEIYVSEAVFRNIENKNDIDAQFVHEEILKNVRHPVKIYQIGASSTISPILENTDHSIAVLPFVNMSNDPEQEYFSDGISEEIINTLAQIPGLKVTGRTSSFSFKGKNVDLREIGKMLNVNMLLEGSVRKSGNKVRITAQLVKTENGYHQWSEKYDRKLDDIFKVQDEIAKSIVDQLQLTFSSKKEIFTSRQQTGNVAAYDLCLKGRQLLYERGLSIFDAIHCFQKAVAIDPDYALAYAGLADANSILGYYGMLPPKESWPQAIRGAEKAIELGPDLAESHCAKAIVYHAHDWEWDKAINEWQIALEINPNYEQARIWYGLFSLQFVQGKNDEAHEQLNIAIENDPLSFYTNSVMGLSLGASGETSEGIKYAKRGVELDPTSYFTIWILGCCYHWAHHFGEAEKELQTALDLSGRHAWALHDLLVTYVNWDKKEKARIIYDEIKIKSQQKYIQPSILASVCAAMGDNDLAMDYINKAYDTHDPSLAFWAKYFPSYGALYKIPGYEVIWQRMGLL